MRILLDYRPALRHRTGVGEFAHQMAAALTRQAGPRDQVVLFSSSWKDRLPPDAVPGAEPLDRRVPVSLLNLAWHRAGWPPIEALGGRADVAWSMHPLLMPARRAAQVITVHDLFFLANPDATVREIRRDYAPLAAAHARRADGIIAVSEYTRRQVVERLGVPERKITVCWNGAPSWAPRREPMVAGPILHVGTIEPRKNVPALLDAYDRLRTLNPQAPPLVFAGRADPALRRPESPAVKYLGYVSDEQRQQLYREASMLVIASTDEGFGIPAIEALTMGVPVIAAARGALPEVVGDAGVLVDAPPSEFSTALASAMARVLDDDALRRDLAQRGIARSRLFSWDASAERAREALAEAVARRKARA